MAFHRGVGHTYGLAFIPCFFQNAIRNARPLLFPGRRVGLFGVPRRAIILLPWHLFTLIQSQLSVTHHVFPMLAFQRLAGEDAGEL